MGRLIWNPVTRQFEEQYVAPVPPPEPSAPSAPSTPSAPSMPAVTPEPETEPEEEPTPEPVEPEEEKKPLGPPSPLPSIYESPAYQKYAAERAAPYTGVVAPAVTPFGEPTVYERPNITATFEQLQDRPLPRKGIVTQGLPPSREMVEQEQQGLLSRAERDVEVRIEGERISFEKEYQPQAQDIVQSRYDQLMGEKARSLGMVLDVATNTWMYTDTGQLENFYNYQPIAQQLALEQGTSFYEQQWEQFGMEERAEHIYREEYGEEGYELIEKDDGTFTVISKKEYARQQRIKRYKEEYRERELGTGIERLSTMFEFWISGFTAEDPFWTKTIGEALIGKEKGKAERLLDIRAKASYEWTTAIKEHGFVGALSQILGPGSPTFTLGATYVGAGLLGGGIGFVSHVAGPTIAKGVGVGVGGFFIGKSAVDVEQITKGKLVKYGPLGIIPLGLMAQDQPLTEAERFSMLAMMGISLPFAVSGYRKGLRMGKGLASELYTPKYKIVEGYAYQKIRPVVDKFGKPIDSEWGIPVKGDIFRTETVARTIFGRQLPFKTKTTVYGEIKGIVGKKTMTYMDSKGSITWHPGEFRGELTSAKLIKTVFGVDLVKTLKNIDGVFTAYPSRALKVDVGKRMGVAIEPYIRTDGLVSVVSKHPGMTLTLTKLQAGRELFKPSVESKFYPSETAAMVKDITSYDRAVTQMWDLPETKAVMKLPHVKKMQVSFFEYGKKIPEYHAGIVPAETLGFTVTTGPLSTPRVFVREPGTGPVVEDLFGRKFVRDPTTQIMRHETLHRMYPGLSEFEIQLIHGKRFPKDIPSSLADFTSVREMKGFHKHARSIVDKAVGEFWKTGEVGISVQTGMDVYKLTGFRQMVSRISPTEVVSGRVFGLSAALTGIEKAGVDVISEPLKAWDTSKTVMKHMDRQTGIIRKPSGPELVVKHPEIKVGVIDVDVGKLWGRGVDVGIMTSTVPASISATESMQMRRTVQTEVNLNKLMQGELQKKMVSSVTSSLLGLDVVSAVETESDLGRRLASAQMQMQLQATELVAKTVTVTPTVSIVPPVVTITPPITVLLSGEEKKFQDLSGGPVFNVKVKDRYIFDGKRVRPQTFSRRNKQPLSMENAYALGGHIVAGNARASFLIEPTEGKPGRLRRGVDPWHTISHQFYEKDGVMIEKTAFRIDSIGELKEITMKGIAARKRGGKHRKTGVPRDFSNIGVKMDRELNRIGRRLII